MPKAFTLQKENSFVEPDFDKLVSSSLNASPDRVRVPIKYTSPEIEEVFLNKSENEEKIKMALRKLTGNNA